MKIELVKQLLQEFENADIQKMKVEIEDLKLELEKAQPTIHSTKAQVLPTSPIKNGESENTVPISKPITSGTAIKSPIVGVYYEASTPNEKPFVTVGDMVSKGQVVCIVEAMKVMNEIKAPMDGVVSAIMVENDDLVEYDQVLMMIEG